MIGFALAQMNPSEPRSGEGVLLTITFRAAADGTSELGLETANLASSEGKLISIATEVGSLRVGPQEEDTPGAATPTDIPTETPGSSAPPATPTPFPTSTPASGPETESTSGSESDVQSDETNPENSEPAPQDEEQALTAPGALEETAPPTEAAARQGASSSPAPTSTHLETSSAEGEALGEAGADCSPTPPAIAPSEGQEDGQTPTEPSEIAHVEQGESSGGSSGSDSPEVARGPAALPRSRLLYLAGGCLTAGLAAMAAAVVIHRRGLGASS